MLYEQRKHDGSLPIIGVNTFRNPERLRRSPDDAGAGPLHRGGEAGPARPAARLPDRATPSERPAALDRLRETALDGGNLFAVLMDAVRCCSLGEITDALFEVGGRYRRNV